MLVHVSKNTHRLPPGYETATAWDRLALSVGAAKNGPYLLVPEGCRTPEDPKLGM